MNLSRALTAALALLCLTGTGRAAPAFAAPPPDIALTIPEGTPTATFSIEIGNVGDEDLLWFALPQAPFSDTTLTGTLARLEAAAPDFIAQLPANFLFSGGVTGNQIGAFPGEPFAGANRFSTIFAPEGIPYSDAQITQTSPSSNLYFTRKFPGLFVYASHATPNSNFLIDGALAPGGADRKIDGSILSFDYAGSTFLGLIKRVYDGDKPSVHHLVITENSPDSSQLFDADDPSSDNHLVSDLRVGNSRTRFFYLLFCTADGSRIDDPTMSDILSAFVRAVIPLTLVATPENGTLPPDQTATIQFTINTENLAPGTHSGTLDIESADPPAGLQIPFQIRITGTGIEHSPNSLDFAAFDGASPSTQTLTITSLEASELTWSAASTAAWIQLGATTGTTPSELAITIDPTLLPPGEQTAATVAITTPDGTKPVTITATFFDATLDQLIPDPARPRIYGVRRGDGRPGSGILFAFDATDGSRLAGLPLSPQITAAAIHPADDLLYLATTDSTTLRRIDLATFTKLSPLNLIIPNIAHLAAGPAGQIYAETANGTIHLLDSENGTSISNQSTGDRAIAAAGASSASPPVYFRSHQSARSLTITRHRLDSNTFQPLAIQLPTPFSPTALLVSAKGTRIFWGGRVFNQDLRFLGDLGTPVLATSPGGELAVTRTNLRRLSAGGANMFTLPFPTELSAISGDAEYLFLYDKFSQSATTIPLRHFTAAPATLDLGSVLLGGDATAEATITNHGVETLTLTGFQSTSGAHAVSTPLPFDIPARSSAPIALTYTPTALGSKPAEITLHTAFIEAPALRLSATGTGTLPPGALPGYAAWQITHFGAADAPDAGPLDDPNRNAWPNFAEFLFDLDPRAHGAPRNNLPRLSKAPDGTALLTFTRVADAAFHLAIQRSTNIAAWSPATAGADFQINSTTDLGDGTERVVLRLPPPADGTTFYRISATASAAP